MRQVTSAAIYARISKDMYGEFLGVRRQEDLCRELADKKNWPVGEVYVDNDISAYQGKRRPAYGRMLSDLESGHRDAVICVDLALSHSDGKLSRDDWMTKRDLLERRIHALSLATRGARDNALESFPLDEHVLRDCWETKGLPWQRRLLLTLFDGVVIHRARVHSHHNPDRIEAIPRDMSLYMRSADTGFEARGDDSTPEPASSNQGSRT